VPEDYDRIPADEPANVPSLTVSKIVSVTLSGLSAAGPMARATLDNAALAWSVRTARRQSHRPRPQRSRDDPQAAPR